MAKLILLCSLFFCSAFCFAQLGDLDPTFGINGIVKADMGSTFPYHVTGNQVLLDVNGGIYLVFEVAGCTQIAKKHQDGTADVSYGNNGFSVAVPISSSHAVIQVDGKIVVVGTVIMHQYYNSSDVGVARFNTNGTLDNSFNSTGILTTSFMSYDTPTCISVQNDGKILVGGYTSNEVYDYAMIARYNPDGSLDLTFNGTGTLITNFASFSFGSAIAVQSDGKIILGGNTPSPSSPNNIYFLQRYNSDGSLDSTLNGDGIVLTDFGDNEVASCIAIQSDGKITVAGYSDKNVQTDFLVARYNLDGSLDSTFNGVGRVLTDFGGHGDTATSMALQKDGKIVLGGYSSNGTSNNFAIARYNSDGSLDNNFGTGGKQLFDFGSSNDYMESIAIQNDGKLMTLGFTVNGANTYIAGARYNSTGSLDSSFQGNGTLIEHLNSGDTHYTSTSIQIDGKILAAGYSWNGINYDFALVRYNTNGTLDNTFSDDGRQMTDFNSADDKAQALAVQSDGKIVVAGTVGESFGIARYNTDGSLDNTFDGNGIVTTDFGSTNYATSIAIQNDGKILAQGSAALARYNTDGSLDLSFHGNGILVTPFTNNSLFNSIGIAIQKDTKILILGHGINPMGNHSFEVARYNINGSLDSTFGDDGLKFSNLDIENYYLSGNSIGLQNDGKIIIGANLIGGFKETYSSFTLTRLNSNGSFDSTFATDGMVFTSPGSYGLDYSTSLSIQSDNKIILGGYSFNGTSNDFTLVGYNADGSLDNTFSVSGIEITPASTADDQIAGIAVADNKLYAVGYGQYPGNFGVVAKYLLASGGPLPVSLLNFTGVLQNKSVLLQWKIATQKNLKGFVIERSPDGNRFLPISYVPAGGVSAFTKNYSIMDKQPIQGINFYRLKMVDADSKFTYSDIVSVRINTDNEFLVFPNPAKTILFVEALGSNETAIVQIVDESGRKLKEVKVFLNGKTSFSVDISNLANGIYNLVLHKNEETKVQTFIKK